ncbi:60S acidic ribosomal protein P2-4 isoform X2 [Hevea brasiliensis]|uniref:60S acidic ribosomal protein P2-4 isoform X2 n=1 Tax=Hevea brasiliensis TaxID=3981 RepID=UPI0025F76701|nr:60S acidic ribosomal protein P2-4 isoform X2 [Hevea brasiliensis]
MKVVAAYLLAVLGGNTSPSAEHIKDILISVDGKDITELIAAGREQSASVPSGGGIAAAAPGSGGGAAAAPAAAEAKKEEKMEEKEESDEDMGFSLFD